MKRPAKPDFAKAQRWWSARPGREKLMLLGGLTLAVLAVIDVAVTSPLDKKLKRAQAHLSSTQKQFEVLANQRNDSAERSRTLREQEGFWRERLTSAQKDMTEARAQASEASRLPETLRAVVGTVGNARLLALELRDAGGSVPGEAAPPAAVTTTATTAAHVTGVAGDTRLYRLPIVLKASGSFAELQLLLQQIERHAGALQWMSVQMDSSNWPEIELTLKAQVLSLEPRWGAGS